MICHTCTVCGGHQLLVCHQLLKTKHLSHKTVKHDECLCQSRHAQNHANAQQKDRNARQEVEVVQVLVQIQPVHLAQLFGVEV